MKEAVNETDLNTALIKSADLRDFPAYADKLDAKSAEVILKAYKDGYFHLEPVNRYYAQAPDDETVKKYTMPHAVIIPDNVIDYVLDILGKYERYQESVKQALG